MGFWYVVEVRASFEFMGLAVGLVRADLHLCWSKSPSTQDKLIRQVDPCDVSYISDTEGIIGWCSVMFI